MTVLQAPGPSGEILFDVMPARPLVILGRNGTGKSALMHQLYSSRGAQEVTYLPGSRTALFDAEGGNLTTAGRRDLSQNIAVWNNAIDVRWRNFAGNQRNEKAIHDLTAAEVQYKMELANAIVDRTDVEKNTKTLQARTSPLDRVNLLLEQANIPIRMKLVGTELKASSEGNTYSFARMSDGERSALILIAEAIAAKAADLLMIDEPELHLHPAIVVPLIAALVKARSDCAFVVSTHELLLPIAIPGARVCLVRRAEWNTAGVIQHWEVDMIEDPDALPEQLRVDILGSRRRVLFTEGEDQSLDAPLYSILFPSVSVRPKGGCREVQKAVSGTRSTSALHHTEGFGLVDNDGMSLAQIAKYQAEHVYALPVFSVESLYYDPDVVSSIAARQAETLRADEAEQQSLVAELVSDAIAGVIVAAGKAGIAENLAGRLAERAVRDTLTANLPQKSDLQALTTPDVTITTLSPYPAELAKFNELRAANDAFGLIGRYRVRSSGMLKAVAEALRFADCENYESAVRSRLSSDTALKDKLRAKLAPLTAALTA